MPLSIGDKLGPYEIVACIGAGGMGEVYRARDTRLGRSVAIKVLLADLSHRQDLRSRFEVEARAIASLNHPSICALFDVGQQEGVAFMVMEYLEGETLAQRLTRGPLPLAEALRYAADITHALEQAHRRGVAHRDLKPANIMLTKTGVKLLDFGLARLREPASGIGDDSPTLDMTRAGLILGTPQYMAPEQVEGKETDTRADIFAFGSVLYEMIRGQKAFRGVTQPEVLTAILRCELPPPLETVPGALNRALKICWAKDPDERWQSAGDLSRELVWIAEAPPSSSADLPRTVGIARREILAWGAAALGSVVATVTMVRNQRAHAPEQRRVRFGIGPPPGGQMNFFQSFPAVSPDGRLVAFSAAAPSTNRLSIWIRALDSSELREIPDTDRAASVFWSPDSRSLGFFSRDKLKRVSLAGGSAQVICDSPIGPGGSWNQAGTILFSRGFNGAIYQVPVAGGTPSPVTSLEPERHIGHWFPSWLPGGRQFLFTARGSQPERQGIYAASLDSKQVNRLLPVASKVRYVTPGYLLFLQGTKIVAQRFDAGRLRVEGDPFPVAEGVWGFQDMGAFDVSDSGVLAFAETDLPSNQLTWFDRSGKALGTAGAAGPFIDMDLSRDERRVLLERYEGGRGEMWILDLERNVPTRLTYGPGWVLNGHWSPDGTRVVYSLASEASMALYVRDADGTGQEQQILNFRESGPQGPSDWPRDGRYVVYSQVASKNALDLWVLPLTPEPAGGDGKPFPYLRSPFLKGQGRVSPDGRWMAYVSTESQTPEVYVSPFPKATAKWRISIAGGTQPRWREDGKELYYLALDHTLMAVPVRAAAGFQPGAAVPLFRASPAEYCQVCRNDYAPSRDGRKFLVNTRIGAAGSQGIQVMVGWQRVTAR